MNQDQSGSYKFDTGHIPQVDAGLPAGLTSPEHLHFIIHGTSHVLHCFLIASNVSDFPSDLASDAANGHLTHTHTADMVLNFLQQNLKRLKRYCYTLPCEVQFCLLLPAKSIAMHLQGPEISRMKVYQSKLASLAQAP